MALEQLLQQRPDIWRGGELPSTAAPGVPSGFAALDALLPGGGWPRGKLSELVSPGPGTFALTLPAVARLSTGQHWVLLVAPPHIPYAPALAARGVVLSRMLVAHPSNRTEALWAAEQGLRSGACAGVLLWIDEVGTGVLRRLQLAAQSGGCVAFLMRPPGVLRQPSPAALRLRVQSLEDGLEVEVLKRQGGFAAAPLLLPWH